MTLQEFNDVITANSVVCCKFSAEWCGPCKAMEPIIKEVADEYKGKAIVLDIDVEDSEDVSTQFRIRNVPTTIFFKDGKVVDKIVGGTTKNVIFEKISSLI